MGLRRKNAQVTLIYFLIKNPPSAARSGGFISPLGVYFKRLAYRFSSSAAFILRTAAAEASNFSFSSALKIELYHILPTVLTNDYRNTDTDILLTVFTAQQYRTREHFLLVAYNRLHKLCTCSAWSIPSRSTD